MEVPNYNLARDFPPHGRRRSSPSRTPHRDPATTSNAPDPDTCRICRGESTPDEPLFYPCKCSGSIKYVHQDCLMEWLSHSQKKHCELCKTPFRFTKLYSPRMPSTLPTHIFVTHMTRYVVDNLIVWLRALLVACVWLFWVPYLMRRGWSLLFWLSDEGLGSLRLARSVGTAVGNATADTAAAANETSVLSTIVSMAENHSAAELLGQNVSNTLHETVPGNSSVASWLPYLIVGAIFPALLPRNGTAMSMQDSSGDFAAQGTLLSNVKFLQNLTRQPLVNRFVIMVLEGQIITVLVIICFILVILVRDYVVQQQPEINMRAAFAAAQDEVRQEEREAAARPQQAAPPRQPRPPFELDTDFDDEFWDSTDEDDEEEPERDARTLIGEGEDESAPRPESQGHVLSRPAGPALDASEAQSSSQTAQGEARPSSSTTPADVESSYLPPGSPRSAEEDRAGRLLRILQETEGDQEAIARVLRDENRARLTGPEREEPPTEEAPVEDASNKAMGTGNPFMHLENTSFIPTPSDSEGERPSKGKAREGPPNEMPSEDNAPKDIVSLNNNDPDKAPYRRRAVSDGPQPREFVNPLANNSWNFSPISTAALSPNEQPGPIAGPSSNPSTANLTDLTPVEESSEGSNTSTDVQAPSVGEPRNGMDLVGEEAHGWEDEPSTPAREATGVAPHNAEAATGQDDPQRPLWARVADFLWGDIGEDNEGAEDEVELVGDDADNGGGDRDHDAAEEDDEDDEEGAAGGLDQDALDDIEDFEGIMELIGMRGPLMGLFQNAVFCACLVLVTVFLCIFIPYNLGRTSVTIAANPVRVVRMFVGLSTLIQDVVAVVVGCMSLSTLSIVSLVRRVFGIQGDDSVSIGITYTWEITANASSRLSDGFLKELPVHASEIQNFSAISHDALVSLKGHIAAVFMALWNLGEFILSSPMSDIVISAGKAVFDTALFARDFVVAMASAILNPAAWIVDLDHSAPSGPINPELASWSGTDRFWAIIAGYLTFALIAGLYVKRWAPISNSQTGQDWEASVVDVINQASGVTKVILIIGIEMLVFPLYCGLLMDAALLPLFEHATIKSRYEFTMDYPLTSMFVHWFVGTGYMFHFALFVSMCRKIMRKGVLCMCSRRYSFVRS